MTPDPDDRPGPGTGEPDPPDSAGPVDDFERIVSGWRSEGAPAWPDDADVLAADVSPTDPGNSGQDDGEEPADDEHFVPPEPPPLPRIGPPALVGLALLGLGLVLLVSPSWVGVPSVYGLPMGLLCLASGLGWLVLRLWPSPPQPGDGDGEDDGAVL